MKINRQNEGVRLPLWMSTLLVAVILPVAQALLTGLGWRDAALFAIAQLGILIGGTEAARRNVYSEDTVAQLQNLHQMLGRYNATEEYAAQALTPTQRVEQAADALSDLDVAQAEALGITFGGTDA